MQAIALPASAASLSMTSCTSSSTVQRSLLFNAPLLGPKSLHASGLQPDGADLKLSDSFHAMLLSVAMAMHKCGEHGQLGDGPGQPRKAGASSKMHLTFETLPWAAACTAWQLTRWVVVSLRSRLLDGQVHSPPAVVIAQRWYGLHTRRCLHETSRYSQNPAAVACAAALQSSSAEAASRLCGLPAAPVLHFRVRWAT